MRERGREREGRERSEIREGEMTNESLLVKNSHMRNWFSAQSIPNWYRLPRVLNFFLPFCVFQNTANAHISHFTWICQHILLYIDDMSSCWKILVMQNTIELRTYILQSVKLRNALPQIGYISRLLLLLFDPLNLYKNFANKKSLESEHFAKNLCKLLFWFT